MLKNNLGEQLTDQKNLNEYVETDYVIFQGPKRDQKSILFSGENIIPFKE